MRLPTGLKKRKEEIELDALSCMLDYFLGERSSFIQLIIDTSNTAYYDVLKFFLACSTTKTFGLSATELCTSKYSVNMPDLLSSNEYYLI